jgi:predicted amidohydrolase
MNALKVSLLQSHLHWEDSRRNLAHFEQLFEQLTTSDLVLLPEMFSTAFTMEAAGNAEPMHGPSMQWMQHWATKLNTVIAGSLIIEEKGKFYNRFIWMQADGTYQHYNKRHLFSMAGEDKAFSAGSERLIIEYKGWRICPLICYDLRFPVWSRNGGGKAGSDYDLLLYVANWPEPRAAAWEKLLYARAIENQCYVAGVNRIGTDKKGLSYIGGSMLIDMKGEPIWKGAQEREEVYSQELSMEALEAFRAKFPVSNDADTFTIL